MFARRGVAVGLALEGIIRPSICRFNGECIFLTAPAKFCSTYHFSLYQSKKTNYRVSGRAGRFPTDS